VLQSIRHSHKVLAIQLLLYRQTYGKAELLTETSSLCNPGYLHQKNKVQWQPRMTQVLQALPDQALAACALEAEVHCNVSVKENSINSKRQAYLFLPLSAVSWPCRQAFAAAAVLKSLDCFCLTLSLPLLLPLLGCFASSSACLWSLSACMQHKGFCSKACRGTPHNQLCQIRSSTHDTKYTPACCAHKQEFVMDRRPNAARPSRILMPSTWTTT